MASLAELRKKVKGVTATRKITRAMKMVAGARFGRAQALLNGSRKFQRELDNVIGEVLTVTEAENEIMRILCGKNVPAGKKVALVVITGDKGLCGDFNNSIVREGDRFIKERAESIAGVFAIGRKACDHYRKIYHTALKEYNNVFNSLDFSLADRIVTDLIAMMGSKEVTEIHVVSASFKSMMKNDVIAKQLIPIKVDKAVKAKDSLLEPIDEREMLAGLLPMVLKARLYNMMRESYVAELSSRMRAMDNATTNAGTLIERITLDMNKVRQASITREIAEIIGTNEVVK